MSVDDRTNQLIVKDTVDVMERIGKMLEVLDTPPSQVLIEAKIVEVIEGFEQKFGFSSGVGFQYNLFSGTGEGGEDTGEFTFSSVSGGGGGGTFLGFNIDVLEKIMGLDLTLELLEKENKGRVISSPKVITQNNKSASINTSHTTSYLAPADAGADDGARAYQTVSAPLSLQVTPQVTNEGSIIMQVAVNKSSFSRTDTGRGGGGAPPDITSNSINTSVLVDNGSTVVVGGLYSFTETESHSGVPFLKDIPLVGWLFRTPYNPARSKQELIIFLTPRIINQEESGVMQENPLG